MMSEETKVVIVKPFTIRIDPDPVGYIVTSEISLVYEAGKVPAHVVAAYMRSLEDHFLWLTEIEATLAPAVLAELTLMRDYLRVVADGKRQTA